MAWIESHQELRGHPKLSALCRNLAAERPTVVGYLHLLWWWCMDYAMDGDLSRYDSQQIADAAEWKGNADKFVAAMKSAGFLDHEKHTVKIHDWYDFCGEIIIKRLRRKDEKRQKSAEIVRQNPPKLAETPPTVPDQTVPDQTKETPPPPKGGFDLIWSKYPRREGRKEAERHYKASVKTMRDFLDLQNAVENYIKKIRREGIEDKYIPHGSTFMNNWRDYVIYGGVQLPKPPPPKPKPAEPPPPEETREDALERHKAMVENIYKGHCRKAPDCPECKEIAEAKAVVASALKSVGGSR